jgi:flagellar biosynthesis/type III secretory pathway chaperone
MTKTTTDSGLATLLEELRRVLEEERGILLSGNAEQINAITQRKMVLADTIERASAGIDRAAPLREILRRLARYNRENSVICTAILRHMTAALDKLQRRDPHRSYGPDGVEHNPPSHRPLGAA